MIDDHSRRAALIDPGMESESVLEVLLRSIRAKLLTLPDRTVVYSGHGPTTTIGDERGGNPFLRGGG